MMFDFLTSFLANAGDILVVIYCAIAFSAAMGGVTAYFRLAKSQKKGYHADEAVVDAVVSEYSRRLGDYDRVIADLRTRIDILEMRSTHDKTQSVISQSPPSSTMPSPVTSQISQQSHAPANHASHVIKGVTITQQHHNDDLPREQLQQPQHQKLSKQQNYLQEAGLGAEGQNGTSDYILKLLAERPRTSREVQQAIGRTREHTARLLKRLHDSNLVSRSSTDKPYTYGITDLGRVRLAEKAEAVPGIRLT